MPFKWVVLWSDALLFLLIISSVIFIFWARRKRHIQEAWRKVLKNSLAMVALIVLSVYVIIGVLDSVHYQVALPQQNANSPVQYSPQVKSVFDTLISPLGQLTEKTYSAPFSLTLFVKEAMMTPAGKQVRGYPHLQSAAQGINTIEQRNQLIRILALKAFLWSALILFILSLLLIRHLRYRLKSTWRETSSMLFSARTEVPWRTILLSLFAVVFLIILSYTLSQYIHIFGTGKVGQDIFYQSLKSIRTGLLIGTLTTLVMLPFAIILGIAAGFFGGLADDIIQYLYTTLSSIPGVLLIAAAILSLQVYIANHPQLFTNLEQRADARLLALCLILGVTSWTGLCRLLRAETLKVREVDYIQSANALGTSRTKIIFKHILPNVMHIVIIAVVLDFSTLVLAEAVLSYVGVGVAPTTISWGNMINSARLQLAREPVVWWPILSAFIFMFLLVLSANLFADAIRDAFDPRKVD